MSQLILSTSLANIHVTGNVVASLRPWFVPAAGTSASIISGSGTAGVSSLIIYKGAVPDLSTLTDRATRNADVLITFVSTETPSWASLGLSGTNFRYQLGTFLNTTAATASGTATWFLLCRSGTTLLTDKGAMLGTIGAIGSGEDLEIGNLDIVSGNSYQSSGFVLNVPLVHDVP